MSRRTWTTRTVWDRSAIVAPDLVKRDFRTLGPNQLWVAVTVKSAAYSMPQTGEDAQNAVGDGAYQLTLRASLAPLAASPSQAHPLRLPP